MAVPKNCLLTKAWKHHVPQWQNTCLACVRPISDASAKRKACFRPDATGSSADLGCVHFKKSSGTAPDFLVGNSCTGEGMNQACNPSPDLGSRRTRTTSCARGIHLGKRHDPVPGKMQTVSCSCGSQTSLNPNLEVFLQTEARVDLVAPQPLSPLDSCSMMEARQEEIRSGVCTGPERVLGEPLPFLCAPRVGLLPLLSSLASR